MRKLEKEEEILGYDDPDKKVFHLCIVNLVIGTLYCSKANFQARKHTPHYTISHHITLHYITSCAGAHPAQFGISRVIKSMEPYSRKLGTQTWFYVKRCFTSLIEAMACATPHHITPHRTTLHHTDRPSRPSSSLPSATRCCRTPLTSSRRASVCFCAVV